jgi:hypothetical protein
MLFLVQESAAGAARTLSRANMRMPLATSMNASFWGVVTITAALNPTVCAIRHCHQSFATFRKLWQRRFLLSDTARRFILPTLNWGCTGDRSGSAQA